MAFAPNVLLMAEFTVRVPAALLPVEIDTFVPALREVFIFDAKIYDETSGTKPLLYAVPLEESPITTSYGSISQVPDDPWVAEALILIPSKKT